MKTKNTIVLTTDNISEISKMSSAVSSPLVIVVNQVIDMNNVPISLADGTIYKFENGGMLKNTTIYGCVQVVVDGLVQIFDNATVPDLLNFEVPIEWFGGVCYSLEGRVTQTPSPTYSDQALADAVISRRGRKILFQSGYYFFSEMVTIANDGIILSGTMSCNRAIDIRRYYNDNYNCVSTLSFNSNSEGTFIRTLCNGTRLENLLLDEINYSRTDTRNNTAVELSNSVISIFVERCMFLNWGKGIYKDNNSTGLSRCIISNCFFNNIKYTAIEANISFCTYNIIRDSWFYKCGCPIRIVSTGMNQDNSIDNCNFNDISFNTENGFYNNYGCCAIYLKSSSIDSNYATNNISRCYFEEIGNNAPQITGDAFVAAVICIDSAIIVDNNFFAAVPRYFLIDDCSSISIRDNGIGKNYSLDNYPLSHNAIVEVIHSNINKNIKQVIIYSNAIPITPSTASCFIQKLVNFNTNVDATRFTVKNYHETRFIDKTPILP